MSYKDFITRKSSVPDPRGLADVPDLADHLFDFQRHCVEFGLRVGSWGLFLDTGLGKTACELEWSKHAAATGNNYALILAPLAVAQQIAAEGQRWGYDSRVIRAQSEALPGINVCNYDRLHLLDPSAFHSVVLDEASILKSFTGKTSSSLIDKFAAHRWKMTATATPAPNDHVELATQSAFVGALTRDEMLMTYFVHDSNDTKSWRVKGHARQSFWSWVASWSRMAEHPRDLGDNMDGFDLPPIKVHRHQVECGPIKGGLFGDVSVSATGLYAMKRKTIDSRADAVAGIVESEPIEPWIIWCDTNAEADALRERIPSATEVRGSHSTEHKEAALGAFASGDVRVLISKPSICGWGLNWQHCARVAFVGRTFSYESYYQAVRRCWRFGQERQVHVHIAVTELDAMVENAVQRKAESHAEMKRFMSVACADNNNISRRGVVYEASQDGRVPAWL